MTLAQDLDGRGTLGVADLLVALLECVRLEALPGQRATQEVHEHVPQRLQVVSPTLFCTFTQTVFITVVHKIQSYSIPSPIISLTFQMFSQIVHIVTKINKSMFDDNHMITIIFSQNCIDKDSMNVYLSLNL